VTAFQAALLDRGLAGLRRCPKSDLHNHAIGGGSRSFIRERTGRDIAPLDRKLASMADMHAWVQASVGDLFDGPQGRLLAFEAALVQADRDGVTRLEIGEDVWAVTLFGTAEKLTGELRRLHRATAPRIELVPQLGLSRHCPVEALERWIEPFLGLDFFRTLDLSGDELAQPIETFKPIYRRARACGLRLKAHAGEWGTADDVWRAVEELELEEVQHGIAAADSPRVMRFLADNGIRLNLCPTSNVMLGRVDGLKAHPIRKLHEAGVRVTVNTDDALVFGHGVSEEFLAIHSAGLLSAAALDAIRLDGLSDAYGLTSPARP
jgi:adenosine deaminase